MTQTDIANANLIKAEESRAIGEVQAALVIGKQFPRDTDISFSRIMSACKRIKLAESAIYSYPKGGKLVTGPSIRMAEVLAQNWGNLSFGLREISQQDGVSIMQAYAWDTETNTKREQIFYVKHERKAGKNTTQLTDSRDIYEMTANQGARRLRACILAIIPGDIVEAAEAECRKTLEHGGGESLVDRIRKMVSKFAEFGVDKKMIEVKLGHNLGATTAPELVTLTAMYRSVKDGMANPSEIFKMENPVQQPKATKPNTNNAEAKEDKQENKMTISASHEKMIRKKLDATGTSAKALCEGFNISKISEMVVGDLNEAFKWMDEQ